MWSACLWNIYENNFFSLLNTVVDTNVAPKPTTTNEKKKRKTKKCSVNTQVSLIRFYCHFVECVTIKSIARKSLCRKIFVTYAIPKYYLRLYVSNSVFNTHIGVTHFYVIECSCLNVKEETISEVNILHKGTKLCKYLM